MSTLVKIPARLPSALAKTRQTGTKYKTTRAWKIFAAFALLKSLTTSGKIQNKYKSKHSFICYLAENCRVSRSTMERLLEEMSSAPWHLVKWHKNDIVLRSWKSICIEYKCSQRNQYHLKVSNEAPLHHVLKVLVFYEGKKRMAFRYAEKIKENNLTEAISNKLTFRPANIEQLAEAILKAQIFSYKKRSESFDYWHNLGNPDFNWNVWTIKRHFGFSCTRSSTYLKKLLEKQKLIAVEKRTIEQPWGRNAGSRTGFAPFYGQTHPEKTGKSRVWHLSDAITLNLKAFAA